MCFGWAKYSHSEDINLTSGATTLKLQAQAGEKRIEVANMQFMIGDDIQVGEEPRTRRVVATGTVLALDVPLTKSHGSGTKVFGSGKPTVEWRPAFVSKVEATPSAAVATDYKLTWSFPHLAPAKEGETAFEKRTRAEEENKTKQPKEWVLLKPRCPQFDDAVHPAHVELLEQASILRQSGKGDFEISTRLQQLLEDKWNAEQDGRGAPAGGGDDVEAQKPPNISPDIVRHYLNAQAEKSQKAAKDSGAIR
jgi:hypothetical protein